MTWNFEASLCDSCHRKQLLNQLASVLRKQCVWQQEYGTENDNGYKYQRLHCAYCPDLSGCVINEAANALEALTQPKEAEYEENSKECDFERGYYSVWSRIEDEHDESSKEIGD